MTGANGIAAVSRNGTTAGEVNLASRPVSAGQLPAPGVVGRLREAHLAMIDAALESDGLERVAEIAAAAAGGPVAIIVPSLTTTVVFASRQPPIDRATYLHWVSERVRGRPAAVPPDVLAEVPIRSRDGVVGIVALLGAPSTPDPDATEFLHLAAAAVRTQLAIEHGKEEVEQRLRGSFLEELRSRQDLGATEIVRRAARLGCDLSRGAVILCVELTSDRPQLVAATITGEHPGALAQLLDGVGSDARPRVYAALPPIGGSGTASSTLAAARKIAAPLQRHGTVGISSFYSDPAKLQSAVEEAELVLDVLHHSETHLAEELGSATYKLLLRVLASHPDEMRAFYDATIAPIVRYDDEYHTELVATLAAYLAANCNMNATASAIFAHRHTIAYRLDRIRDLTGLDPTVSEDRERLGLGLKAYRLIAPRLPR